MMSRKNRVKVAMLEEPVSGVWWLPGSHRSYRRGVLQQVENGFELKLERSLPSDVVKSIEHSERLTVWGKDEHGRKVSLFGFLLTDWRMLLSGLQLPVFHINSAFLGIHSKNADEAKFAQLGARFPALDEWLGISGLKVTSRPGVEYEIQFSPPTNVEFDLGRGLRLIFGFSWQGPTLRRPQMEVSISQQCELILQASPRRKFGELHEIFSRMTNLFSLLIGEAVSHEAMWARSNKVNNPSGTVDILFDPIAPEIWGKTVDSHRILLRFGELQGDPAVIFKRWLDKYKIYHSAFALYFSVQSRDPGFQEQRFLSIVQSLETLHRLGNPKEPSAKHVARLERIKGLLESKDWKWLGGQLRHSHEPTLLSRLEDLLSPFGDLFGNLDKRRRFAQKTADTRNYLTHYDPEQESKAVEPSRLLPYIFRLRGLFVLRCLLEIGFAPEVARQIVEKNNRLRQMVRFGEV